jgi:SAM-dependent methyltransferase
MTAWETSHSSVGSRAAAFDAWACVYERELQKGLRYSGESGSYFALGRVKALVPHVKQLAPSPSLVLDYGCGTGTATPLLARALGAQRAIGVDVSTRLLARAQATHRSERIEFRLAAHRLQCCVDVAYCNGVFHHIGVHDRGGSVDYLFSALRPGGLFAFFENNALNPGTRLVMRSIPFDCEAEPLSAGEARRLLRAGGFEILTTEYLFVFPHAVRALRRFEPHLGRLPIGAQYMVLCRKPQANGG